MSSGRAAAIGSTHFGAINLVKLVTIYHHSPKPIHV